MKFKIEVRVRDKWHTLQVERVYESDQVERFKVSGKDRFAVFECNRPVLKHRKRNYNWKVREGKFEYQSTAETIAEALDNALYRISEQGKTYINPKNSTYWDEDKGVDF